MRRSDIPEGLADPSLWPTVDVTALAGERRDVYQRREQAICAYLRGETRADIEHLCALDEFDLLLIEQPIHEEDYLGHKLLAKRMRTPVCLDESVLSADNAESLIDYGACEIANIKAGRVGGYLSAKAIHDVAVARGVPVWCGGMVETGIGRAANIALASLPGFTLPGDTSSSSRFYSLDVTEPFVMDADGLMTVPTGPGLGVTPTPDVLAELTNSREELIGSSKRR